MIVSDITVHCKYDYISPVGELRPFPKNRNSHPDDQIERLAKLIKYQGMRAPIIVDAGDRKTIVKGHGTLSACKLLGMSGVPVVLQEFESEEQRYAFVQSDNAIASWSELDFSGINVDLPDLGPEFDVELLGIKGFEIEPADKYGDKDADKVPEVHTTNINRGDLYQLGSHRLLCGDSTDPQAIAILMNGEKADMVFTDPPYGVNAVHNERVGVSGPTGWGKATGEGAGCIYKAGVYRKIEGDDKPFNPELLLSFECPKIIWGGNYFSDRLPIGFRWLVWDKKDGGIGGDDNTFSDCELAWTSLDGRAVKIYRHLWSGLLRTGDRKEELSKRVHPTQKPVGLCAEMLGDWSKENQIIVDLYLGSGSTLIACEKTNRKCYGMEIDPAYCQVIIDRWEKFTGQKAEKINDMVK